MYSLLLSGDFIATLYGIALRLNLQAATYSPAHLLLPQETHPAQLAMTLCRSRS